MVGVRCERRKLLLRRSRKDRTTAQSCTKERSRLSSMDAAQLLHRDLAVLRLEIERLPADHALGTGRTADLVHHAQQCLSGYIRLPQDHRKCQCEECIPSKYRNPVAIDNMVRRLPAPQCIIVHCGQIIVNQRVGMDHLKGTRHRQEFRPVCTYSIRCRHQENRTQTLAARHEAVLHRRTQRRIEHRSFCELLRKCRLDKLPSFLPEFLHLILRSAAILP